MELSGDSNSRWKDKGGKSFKELLDICHETEWISYIKQAFNGAHSVIHYLGRYTHRIAIGNRRIISMDACTAKRFCENPSLRTAFQQNQKIQDALCRNLLGCKQYLSKLRGMNTKQLMKVLYNMDIRRCPECGGHMISVGHSRFHRGE